MEYIRVKEYFKLQDKPLVRGNDGIVYKDCRTYLGNTWFGTYRYKMLSVAEVEVRTTGEEWLEVLGESK